MGEQLNAAVAKRDTAKITETSKDLGECNSELERLSVLVELKEQLASATELLESADDDEMLKMAEAEVKNLKKRLKELQSSGGLRGSENTAIVEIRAGTGGEEAALFASDLYGMYTKFAETNKWKVEIMDLSKTTLGGLKTMVFKVDGEGAYRALKFESGVHRVQRVPSTESSGRIHTSTATVAVLPAKAAKEIEVKPSDVVIESFRSGGPGGQSVNTTDSAVRVTHTPTGIVVKTQKSRSQIKNRELALEILRAKLFEAQQTQLAEERGELRRSQIGTGGRAEKIRTYNFPQDRITDHRVKKSWHGMEKVLSGEMGGISKFLLAELGKNDVEDAD